MTFRELWRGLGGAVRVGMEYLAMRYLVLAAAMLAMSAPVMARQPSDEKKPDDPTRMVCRSSEVIGSRLATKKTCMTAMQWKQLEREQRDTVERIQSFKPNNGN